jgi:hypothetical protein
VTAPAAVTVIVGSEGFTVTVRPGSVTLTDSQTGDSTVSAAVVSWSKDAVTPRNLRPKVRMSVELMKRR